MTARRVADEARACGLAFMHGVASGWTKRELARWLAGPFARVTSYAGRHAHSRSPWAPPAPGMASLDDQGISSVLRETRWAVMAELETAALPNGTPAFADRLLAHGFVRPARVPDGIAWLPVDAHARFKWRVLGLFAADALARPDDYTAALFVCHRCEAVSFDATARMLGRCSNHPQPRGGR